MVTIKYNNGEYAFLVFFKERKRGLMWNVECGMWSEGIELFTFFFG